KPGRATRLENGLSRARSRRSAAAGALGFVEVVSDLSGVVEGIAGVLEGAQRPGERVQAQPVGVGEPAQGVVELSQRQSSAFAAEPLVNLRQSWTGQRVAYLQFFDRRENAAIQSIAWCGHRRRCVWKRDRARHGRVVPTLAASEM